MCKLNPDDQTPVKGQIIFSLLSRDTISGTGNPPMAIVGPAGEVRGPQEEEITTEHTTTTTTTSTTTAAALPEGYEERRTPDGRIYYVNHVSRTTQWTRPTQPASASAANGHHNGIELLSTPPGPSRSATMNNIEQSPSNGSLNESIQRNLSSENLISINGNGEITMSKSSNSINENNKNSNSNATTTTNNNNNNNNINKPPSPKNTTLQALTNNLVSLTIDGKSNDENLTITTTTTSSTPTTTVVTSHTRNVNKISATNLSSPIHQQQVPPNTTAPMSNTNSVGNRSPPTIEIGPQQNPRTPDNSQNRNAVEGENNLTFAI